MLLPVELESRYEVYTEIYVLSIDVEAKLLVEMAKTMIYPAAMRYLTELAASGAGVAGTGIDFDASVVKNHC